ncbi:MAG: hypothetical protein AAFY88_15235 [Acidobacteriota bacterium]
MILNNLGNASVNDDKLVTFTEQSVMDWRVRSSNGQELTGRLGASEYTEVTPPGDGPWSVKMGSSDFSRSASVNGVADANSALSCLIVFPIGPNSAHIFVDKKS